MIRPVTGDEVSWVHITSSAASILLARAAQTNVPSSSSNNRVLARRASNSFAGSKGAILRLHKGGECARKTLELINGAFDRFSM